MNKVLCLHQMRPYQTSQCVMAPANSLQNDQQFGLIHKQRFVRQVFLAGSNLAV